MDNRAKKEGLAIAQHWLGFGSTLAIVVSYSINKSIFWAMLHGICSWFYIIYYTLNGE